VRYLVHGGRGGGGVDCFPVTKLTIYKNKRLADFYSPMYFLHQLKSTCASVPLVEMQGNRVGGEDSQFPSLQVAFDDSLDVILPANLPALPNLMELELGDLRVTEFPAAVAVKLSKLTLLGLFGKHLSGIAPSLSALSVLSSLTWTESNHLQLDLQDVRLLI